MSTEIDEITQTEKVEPQVSAEHANGDLPAGAPVEAAAPVSEPKLWQQRWFRFAAGAVIILIVAAVVGNNMIARQYTPDGAVRAYLSALQSGNASSAWDQIAVSVPPGKASASVVDESALQAALRSGKPDIRSFVITQTVNATPDTASVSFTYDSASGSHQGSFAVQKSGQTHFGIYPDWHVIVPAAVLEVTIPTATGTVAIDGKALALTATTSQIAVLPVEHQVQLVGTSMLQTQTAPVDALFATQASVSFLPKLTDLGLQKTKAAVTAAFAACAKQTGTGADGCPQSVESTLNLTGHWQLIGDPTQDLAVGMDKDYGLSATGHFQMVMAYNEDGVSGTIHSVSAGGYITSLQLSANDITVGPLIYATGLPALVRPAGATDDAAKALVRKAFTACAATASASPADCPQTLVLVVANLSSWTLNGDPLADATVAFDPSTGVITVSGTFQMTANYTMMGYRYTGGSDTSAYHAYLVWNGQALQLITINGQW